MSAPAPSRTRSPLMELLVLAAPTIATMTSYTLMQFVDKLMVSRIGANPIYVGAQGNGGLASFVPISILTGLVVVVNTFVSQNLGAGKPERAPAYAWTGLWLTLAYWLIVMLPIGLFLAPLFDAIRDPDLRGPELASALERDHLAAGYGRILIYGSIFTMAARAIAQYFYGMHRPGIVLLASLTGNIINFILNTLLVYGPTPPAHTDIAPLDAWFHFSADLSTRLGLSAHGLNGSAYATVIGTLVELIIPLTLFLSPRFNRLYATRSHWRPSLLHIRELIRIGWPSALMFGNEMICWAFFMVYLVGHFGSSHSTAGWIAHQWMTLSFMPTVGLSVAITASVGKCMGMNRPDLAARRAWLGFRLSVTYMGLCGLAFVLFRHQLAALFVERNTPPEQAEVIIRMGARFLIAAAAFQLFDGVAMSLSGALRGAGDTTFTGVATILLSWTLIVGGGLALVHFAPGLQSLGPWIAAAAYIISLAMVTLARFLTGKWKSLHLVEPDTNSPGANNPSPAPNSPNS